MAAPLREQSPYISSGTWSLLGIEEERAHADATARENGYSNEGGFGPRTLLLNNIMGLWIIQQYRHELGDRYSFAELVERAESSENDMLFDVNKQKFMAPESMTKVIEEEIGEGHSIGEIAFAVYNSLAHSYAQSIKALEEIVGRSFDTLNIIGGGSKNLLLNRLTAKATGLKVITGPAEGTAIGNLLAQMIGLGDLKDVAEGRVLVANSFEVEEF